MLRLGMVVLSVADMQRAVDFWSQALGYRLREGGPDGHWAVLTPASGSSMELALQVSTTPVQRHPRVPWTRPRTTPHSRLRRSSG